MARQPTRQRAVVALLRQEGRLTALELAEAIARAAHGREPTRGEVTSTHGALRTLADKGEVVVERTWRLVEEEDRQ